MAKIEVEIADPTPDPGRFRLVWQAGSRIWVINNDEVLAIRANRPGLISLASHLLALAQETIPSGTHLHLDPLNGLEDDSPEITLQVVD